MTFGSDDVFVIEHNLKMIISVVRVCYITTIRRSTFLFRNIKTDLNNSAVCFNKQICDILLNCSCFDIMSAININYYDLYAVDQFMGEKTLRQYFLLDITP